MMQRRIRFMAVLLAVLLISAESQAQAPSTVTDIDGNMYQTIKIGDQVWMTDNLKATKFNDGTPISRIMRNGPADPHPGIVGMLTIKANIKTCMAPCITGTR